MMTFSSATPALNAYRATAGLGGAEAPGAAGGPGEGFEAVLGQVMQQAVTQARQADQATQAGLTGQMGTTEVVMAVSRAELALQTAVAVRDRMVTAYQDVMRMAV
ncbi:flagellar hook-basal body complex protein FliE [Roseomonas stagni]|uniref:Flagellar hook-basal body complex protein FliE n=1 Tax=Falsiroseomonas algicola TaxID=2716930 RepID=A0A6M1LNX8_9PROT|nr:flagellar hook-basal body complex protein FliE [Falsiroseomonas algicola]NGM21742.1 flagellar hook-basal body complex protein FliE [Falsiroseomonas algicola]